MTRRTILCMAASGLLLSGCGTRQSLYRTPQAEIPSAPSQRILYPETNNRSAGEIVREEMPAPPAEPVRPPLKPDRPRITFTGVESAHVRVPGVNPLPASGLLTVPLGELREEFCYPYKGRVISPYGPRGRSMHTGVDIKAVPGDTVRAALPGVVRMSKYYSGYGNIVVIRHYEGFETVYAHNVKNLVEVNDVVEAGRPIALAGRTGRATTEHVHFELRAAGEPLDPMKLIDGEAMDLRSDTLYICNRAGRIFAYNSAAEGRRLGVPAAPATDERSESEGGGLTEEPAEVRKPEAPAVQPAAKLTPAKPAAAAPVYYKVRPGDTQTQSARRNGTTVAALCKLNKIDKDAVIRIGQRLRIK